MTNGWHPDHHLWRNGRLWWWLPARSIGRILYMLAMRGGRSIGDLLTGGSVKVLGIRSALFIDGALAVVVQLTLARIWGTCRDVARRFGQCELAERRGQLTGERHLGAGGTIGSTSTRRSATGVPQLLHDDAPGNPVRTRRPRLLVRARPCAWRR